MDGMNVTLATDRASTRVSDKLMRRALGALRRGAGRTGVAAPEEGNADYFQDRWTRSVPARGACSVPISGSTCSFCVLPTAGGVVRGWGYLSRCWLMTLLNRLAVVPLLIKALHFSAAHASSALFTRLAGLCGLGGAVRRGIAAILGLVLLPRYGRWRGSVALVGLGKGHALGVAPGALDFVHVGANRLAASWP